MNKIELENQTVYAVHSWKYLLADGWLPLCYNIESFTNKS